jgi:hypothetical protein
VTPLKIVHQSPHRVASDITAVLRNGCKKPQKEMVLVIALRPHSPKHVRGS